MKDMAGDWQGAQCAMLISACQLCPTLWTVHPSEPTYGQAEAKTDEQSCARNFDEPANPDDNDDADEECFPPNMTMVKKKRMKNVMHCTGDEKYPI